MITKSIFCIKRIIYSSRYKNDQSLPIISLRGKKKRVLEDNVTDVMIQIWELQKETCCIGNHM